MSSYLAIPVNFFKFHRGDSVKMTVFNRLFKQNLHTPKVMIVSVDEMLGKFILFKGRSLKNSNEK